jgi:hypothetical protein
VQAAVQAAVQATVQATMQTTVWGWRHAHDLHKKIKMCKYTQANKTERHTALKHGYIRDIITHVKPRLRPQLLSKEGHGYLELEPAVGRALHILKPLPEAHVPPDGLHHPQTDAVKLAAHPYRRQLVVHRAPERLQPGHEPLVPLEVDHHLAAARGKGMPPVFPRVDHAHVFHVQALHVSARH